MTDVAAFIEDELGLEVTAEQRRVLHAMFPPPPPYVPPKQPWKIQARRWFRRVILRVPGPSMCRWSSFDKALKEYYAPVLREQLNKPSPFLSMKPGPVGQRAVRTIRDVPYDWKADD